MSKHITITHDNKYHLPIGTVTVLDEVADALIADGQAIIATELAKPITPDTTPTIIVKDETGTEPKKKGN